MENETIILDEETWIEYYGLVSNPYTSLALFSSQNKDDLALVLDTVPLNRVWSWLPDDEDEFADFVQNGYHPDKAMGYYITEAPYEPTQKSIVNLS